MVKINPSEKIEVIEIKLSKEKTPIAFEAKVNELMEQGMFSLPRKEVENYVSNMVFQLELYYEKEQGLFGLESEALDCCGTLDFFSPYTGERLIEEENR